MCSAQFYEREEGITVTIDVSLVISLASVGFAIFAGIVNLKRNKTVDDKKEATETTAVIVKLENIANDVKEIKNELRSVRNEVRDLSDRTIITEQMAKSLHKRVDMHEERLQKLEELLYKREAKGAVM